MANLLRNASSAASLVDSADLNEILGTALLSVNGFLDALDASATIGTVYNAPNLLLSYPKLVLGEHDDLLARMKADQICELVELHWWNGLSAADINAVFAGDKDGMLFKHLLDIAIILRARGELGDSADRRGAFRNALNAFKKAAGEKVDFELAADPYVLLNTEGLDFDLPEYCGAAEIVEFAHGVVSEFYDDLRSVAEREEVYEDAFVLMSFDKVSVGGAPQVGFIHKSASVTGEVGKVMLFPDAISAGDVLRAFEFDEDELRVILTAAVIHLRRLHERGANRAVEKELDATVATLKSKLWYGLNAA